MTGESAPQDPLAEFLDSARRAGLPGMVRGSNVGLTVVPAEGPDLKVALELGLMLLFGKPLVLMVPPGTEVPDGLVRAADAIVDMSGDWQAGLQEALTRISPTWRGQA